jgi:hypothetical protein
MSVLSEKAVLVKMSIKKMGEKKSDKDAGEVVDREFETENVGLFYKKLYPKELLSEIRTLLSQTRAYFTKMTKPWEDGYGVLPNNLWAEFTQKINEFKTELENKVNTVRANFPQAIDEMKLVNKGLFKLEDYPKIDEITNKFKIDIKTKLVPDTKDDIRLTLTDGQIEAIREEMKKREQGQIEHLTFSLWKDLREPLKKLQKSLSNADSNIRKGTLEKINEMLDLLPSFNFFGNQRIDDMVAETKAIVKLDVDSLNLDVNYREESNKKVEEILEKMEGY